MQRLCKAIDTYLAKADADLTDTLRDEGFVDPEGTVRAVSALEDETAAVLRQQNMFLESSLAGIFSISVLDDVMQADTTDVALSRIYRQAFEAEIPQFKLSYVRRTAPDLTVPRLTDRTVTWAQEWSPELGRLMKLPAHNELERLVTQALDEGKSVEWLRLAFQQSGIRDTYERARRAALTEMLRAHSVAAQEALIQDPSVVGKEWVHTGGWRNRPRDNHVTMNGQVVPKSAPFRLIGRDGTTYAPMYPHDPVLPASESVNCHCLHRAVTDDEISRLPLEDRQQLQTAAVDANNADWDLTNGTERGIMGNMIRKPIELPHNGRGNPNAILHYAAPLTARQQKLDAALPAFDSRAVVSKNEVNMSDLAALTATNGVEYTMFTLGSKRLVVRGNDIRCNISPETARDLAAEGWRWSGHTHPGIAQNTLIASEGDMRVLEAFPQKGSQIYNSLGKRTDFYKDGV